MRTRLKGVNSVRKKRADGTTTTYFYAWKGGPRLPGKPGSAEFVAAYTEAVSARRQAPEGTLQAVLDAYQRSTRFADLAPRTRADYIKHIKIIEAKFSRFPVAGLADNRARRVFLDWREARAKHSRRQAQYTLAVLALILAWALDRGLVLTNPLERAGRIYRSKRVEKIWTDADEAAFNAAAPERLRLALMLALWTGQRQGDLLALKWSDYDGERIRLVQGKTGVRVAIPVGSALRAVLDATPRRGGTILTTEAGTAWTEGGFRASWRTACRKAGITGLTFHDLRGSAVTRLAEAKCTVPQIAAITGHSLHDVGAILDQYLSRTDELADEAIRNLESHVRGKTIPN